MGQIYRAVDRVTGKSVALKVLRDEKVGDAARFEHEAQVLAELDHDAIVRYVAHGRAEQGWFLAMEWLEGEDLSERLHRAPLAPAEAVSMLARIADALAVAHARGVVHRDVKPSNIFLPDGDPSRAKLLDFGVARSTVASRPETVTGTALGTPGYMAPEQARGERDLDARVDVFAMGAVLFRCLAGTPPFDAANTVAVLSKVLFDEPPPLAEIRPDLPPEVHAAVALMLAKDRAVRPADGAALARMLWDLAPQVALAAPPSAAGAGITGGEDRIRSSVMVRRGGQVPRPVADTSGIIGGSTLPTVALVEDASTVAAMRLALSMRGAFEKLADGTWAIVFAGEGATEMATRACRFALALRERFPEARIAIATGRARAASTVTHGAFDRAGRLLSDLPPCTIVVDDVTASLVEARLAIERGPAGLVVVGEVGERATGRRVHGVVTPFVGRQKELRLLDGLFAGAVEDGRPAAALVVGTAGSGKSRLAAELIARIESDGAVVWRGDADPLASSAPFAPVARILRRALGAAGPRPAPISRETIELRVREVMAGDDATRVIAAVRSLLDVTTSAADDAVDPVARGDRIRRAVEDWIAAEARRQPLAIILDDVHWADPGTIALIDGVLRNVEGPVFVLALARPEVHDRFPRLWADRGVTTVQLAPLSSNAATQLARAALGVTAADELVATLAERSAGNPFFLEELVRARADRGTDEWPETVLATVEARLATLDGDARRLLRAAAVIGPVFWPGAVIHLVGGAPFASTVTSRLETLIAREFVIASPESRFVGERQLAFRHALVRDAAYDTLPEEDRELAHKLAAEWLERVGEAPAVIAEHLVRAGAAEAAVSHCVSAAEAALVGDDVAGALALCERGVEAGASGERLGALRWLEAEA
ncbi:MAG: AAA family ATPase, partial [Myxococcales bacterium]|nr:AAA family ATPase [Myxococcales bacterium]